jgi:hypothetical protein
VSKLVDQVHSKEELIPRRFIVVTAIVPRVVEPRFPQPRRAIDNSIHRETKYSRQQRHQVLFSGIKGERGAGQVKTAEDLQASSRPSWH